MILDMVRSQVEKAVEGATDVSAVSIKGSRDSGSIEDRLLSNAQYLHQGIVDTLVCVDEEVVTEMPGGLTLAAVLPGRVAQEAIVMKDAVPLSELPAEANVCVACARQRLQIESKHPHLNVVEMDGGLQEQLRLLHCGDFDACVVSAAELHRWDSTFKELLLLDAEELKPAFGQGVIGLICRENDQATVDLLKAFDDPVTRTCVEAERNIVKRLEVWNGAAAGGVAQVLPDGQLQIQCVLASPGPSMLSFDRMGPQEEASSLSRECAKEFAAHKMQLMLESAAVEAKAEQAKAEQAKAEAEEAEEAEEGAANEVEESPEDVTEVLPPIFGAERRLSPEEMDTTGLTSYEGRVAMVFLHNGLAVVDVNCTEPALWYAGEAPEVGSTVTLFFTSYQRHRLFALKEQPPRLTLRGSGERKLLDSLSSGDGPFRAIVISCTAEGVLVDFNCEVAGQLQSRSPHTTGEELRVYILEVDPVVGTCSVTVKNKQQQQKPGRRRLKELAVGGEIPYMGSVRRITQRGAMVDFGCEVPGYIGAVDIDMSALPNGLLVGQELLVFVSWLDMPRRRVGLSMFKPQMPQMKKK